MHMTAANVCVWLRVIVLETLAAGVAARLLRTSAVDGLTGSSSVTSGFGTDTPAAYHHLTVPVDDLAVPRIRVDRLAFHGRQLNASGTGIG